MKTRSVIYVLFLCLIISIFSCDGKRATFDYDIPELNEPPQEEPTIDVPGHGVVHRGRTDVPFGNNPDETRPYIWLWFVPAENNECGREGAYRWYQFVNLRFYINDEEKQLNDGILGATGLEYKFGEWNPDYHKDDPECDGPDFIPDGLGLDPNNPGKPYNHNWISGTRTSGGTSPLTGILDSPDFCNRKDDKQSPIERLLGRFIPSKEKEQTDKPPDQDVEVRVEIDVRSYLVCVQGEQTHCVGYVDWSQVNGATIRLVWQEVGSIGLTKQWKLGSEIIRKWYTLTIGDWHQPC